MGVAGATIGAGVLSAGSSLYGSSQASGGASDASKLNLEMYNQTRSDLLPYNVWGQNALKGAGYIADNGPSMGPDYISMAQANLPGQMTQEQLEATPGYKFNLSQGLKAVQQSGAARGLGLGGASLKGAAAYATGLADSTYQNQFNNAQTKFNDYINLNTGQQTNRTNQFNQLSSLATLGENAAAGTGNAGTSAASTAGNYLNQAGQANAAGTTGVANSITNSANSYLGQQNFNQLMSQYGGSGSTTGGYSSPFSGAGSDVTASTFV
jgi:hypothetical protein